MRLTPAHRPAAQAGLSLIELMVGIAIAAILLLLAAPLYTDFIANTNIRSAAENTVTGLRRAHSEAINRNSNVRFVLEGGGWTVQEVDVDGAAVGDPVATYKFSEGASKAIVDSLDGGTTVTFNGLGRVLAVNPDGNARISDIQFTTTMIDDPKILHVVVGNDKSATGIRVCDTHFPADDPNGCPDGISNR